MNLDKLIGFKFLQIINLKRQIVDQEIKALGLSRLQWQIFAWMGILGLPCSQKELLQNMEMDRGNLARLLDQLETDELVARTPILGNRRSLEIALRPKGTIIMEKVSKALQKENACMLDGMNKKEVQNLEILLVQVIENLQTVVEK